MAVYRTSNIELCTIWASKFFKLHLFDIGHGFGCTKSPSFQGFDIVYHIFNQLMSNDQTFSNFP